MANKQQNKQLLNNTEIKLKKIMNKSSVDSIPLSNKEQLLSQKNEL